MFWDDDNPCEGDACTLTDRWRWSYTAGVLLALTTPLMPDDADVIGLKQVLDGLSAACLDGCGQDVQDIRSAAKPVHEKFLSLVSSGPSTFPPLEIQRLECSMVCTPADAWRAVLQYQLISAMRSELPNKTGIPEVAGTVELVQGVLPGQYTALVDTYHPTMAAMYSRAHASITGNTDIPQDQGAHAQTQPTPTKGAGNTILAVAALWWILR